MPRPNMRLPRSIEDKYEVLRQLGEGGMGAVFTVRHRLLNELRVIKIIRPAIAADANLRARFLREAQAAAELRHPNVAQVHDFAIDPDGTPYIVMEFIAGLSWRELIDRHGGLPVPLAVEMASQCLRALEYLHQRDFVHRDISPDNLMLSRDVDGRPWVKLIDLGLAKRLTGDLGLTATGWFLGKLRYASPEQFRGSSGDLGPRSDLYSLGVVLFELLTGVCPIDGDTPERIIGSHLQPTRELVEDPAGSALPAALRQLVETALEAEPEKRPRTAGEFRRHLQPFLTGGLTGLDDILPPGDEDATLALPTARASDVLPGPASARSQNRLRGRLALIATAAALALLLAWFWQGWPRESRQDATGIAVIDAAPWAELTRVVDERGELVPLSEPTETPAVLHLAPGRYSLGLVHPELSRERRIEIEVVANETVQSSVDLRLLDLDRYFADAGLAEVLGEAGSE